MEDASIGEDKECASDDEYEKGTGQVLFDEGDGRTASCYLKHPLALLEEGGQERYFLEELALSFFDSGLVDILVVGEQDVGVGWKVYRRLIVPVDYLV